MWIALASLILLLWAVPQKIKVRVCGVMHGQGELDAEEPIPTHSLYMTSRAREVPGVGVLPLGRPGAGAAFRLCRDLDEPLQQRQSFRTPGLRQRDPLPLLFGTFR